MRTLQESANMKRPLGVTLIATLTSVVAAVLVLACIAFAFVAIMTMTGEGFDQATTAITGMAIGGSVSLIILAGVAAGLAMALFELREWAWSASIVSIGLGTVCTVLGLLAFRRFFLMPLALSVLCHLLVLAISVYTLSYLLKPAVRQAFTTSNA
jgi:preprotein translocase subunit SecY